MKGKVKFYDKEKGFGFVYTPQGDAYFGDWDRLCTDTERGTEVFIEEILQTDKGRRAKWILCRACYEEKEMRRKRKEAFLGLLRQDIVVLCRHPAPQERVTEDEIFLECYRIRILYRSYLESWFQNNVDLALVDKMDLKPQEHRIRLLRSFMHLDAARQFIREQFRESARIHLEEDDGRRAAARKACYEFIKVLDRRLPPTTYHWLSGKDPPSEWDESGVAVDSWQVRDDGKTIRDVATSEELARLEQLRKKTLRWSGQTNAFDVRIVTAERCLLEEEAEYAIRSGEIRMSGCAVLESLPKKLVENASVILSSILDSMKTS